MSQSKKHSTLEGFTNAVIGIMVSYVTQLLVFPLFGIHVSHETNGAITLIFFLISFTRSYLVRRWFNKLHQGSLIPSMPRYENPPPPPEKKEIPEDLPILREHF